MARRGPRARWRFARSPERGARAESASIPQGTGWKCGVLRVGSPLLAAGLVRADAQRLRQMEGLSAALRLFDVACCTHRAVWKRTWRAWLRLFNILQFANAAEFVATSGLREGLYDSLLGLEVPRVRDQAPGGLAALLAEVDVSLRPLVQAVAAAGRYVAFTRLRTRRRRRGDRRDGRVGRGNAPRFGAVHMDDEVEYLERFARTGLDRVRRWLRWPSGKTA